MNSDNRPTGLGALAQRVILADVKLKRAEQVVEDLKNDLEAAKAQMQAAFAENGVSSVKYHCHTVYSHESIYGALVSLPTEGDDDPKAPAIKALKGNGLEWMVKETVNQNTLSAWVREQPVDKATRLPVLPAPLVKFIRITTKPDIRIKRA